jgi:hypothetical protein
MRKRHWKPQRQFMTHPQAQQRWDQAFQSLLSLNNSTLPLPLQPLAQKLELEEVAHASSSLCTGLNPTSGPGPNH